MNAKTNGNQEFLSLLACICADGTKLPVKLIYKSESHNLQDSWVEDIGEDIAYFAASDNRWSCNSLGLQWLKKVFKQHKKEKAQKTYTKQLLIVDGYLSYINIAFLDYVDRHSIIVYILLVHLTH